MMKQLLWMALVCLGWVGCIRETYNLDSDGILVSGQSSPVFSIPLGSAEVTAVDALVWLDSAGISAEVDGEGIALFEPFDVLDTSANTLLQIESLSYNDVITIPADIPPGVEIEVPWVLPLFLPDGLALDSLRIASGSLGIVPSDNLPMDALVILSFAEWNQFGSPYSFAIGAAAEQQSLNGITWLENGTPGLDLLVTLDSPDQGFEAGTEIGLELDFEIDQVEWVVGSLNDFTFGSFDLELPFEALDPLNPGVVHVAEPRLELEAINGTGWSLEPVVTSASFLTSMGESAIEGDDLQNIPEISGATGFPNSLPAEWEHTVENSGTSPTLTTILESSPESMRLEGHVEAAQSPGFLTQDALIRMTGRLVLPLEGWLHEYGFRDTVDVDWTDIFEERFEDRFSWEDVDTLAIRAFWNNELPVSVSPKLTFLDAEGDELMAWYQEDDAFEWMPAQSQSLVDWVITGEELALLAEAAPDQLAWAALLSTPNATEENVFISADAHLGVSFGLKVVLNVDYNE